MQTVLYDAARVSVDKSRHVVTLAHIGAQGFGQTYIEIHEAVFVQIDVQRLLAGMLHVERHFIGIDVLECSGVIFERKLFRHVTSPHTETEHKVAVVIGFGCAHAATLVAYESGHHIAVGHGCIVKTTQVYTHLHIHVIGEFTL